MKPLGVVKRARWRGEDGDCRRRPEAIACRAGAAREAEARGLEVRRRRPADLSSAVRVRYAVGVNTRARYSLAVVSLAVLSACATTTPRTSTPRTGPPAPEVGVASFYAESLHGRRTASGERYDKQALTAAHPSLPFGSRVRVTNLHNGQSVVVRINDRGPFVEKRVIDLSYAAARKLGFIDQGTTRVRLEVLDGSPAQHH